jgi:hypothetical protein
MVQRHGQRYFNCGQRDLQRTDRGMSVRNTKDAQCAGVHDTCCGHSREAGIIPRSEWVRVQVHRTSAICRPSTEQGTDRPRHASGKVNSPRSPQIACIRYLPEDVLLTMAVSEGKRHNRTEITPPDQDGGFAVPFSVPLPPTARQRIHHRSDRG